MKSNAIFAIIVSLVVLGAAFVVLTNDLLTDSNTIDDTKEPEVKYSFPTQDRGSESWSLKVIVKDEYDTWSEWSNPLTITSSKVKNIGLSPYENILAKFLFFKANF
jgi:hypothetical protein